MEEHTFQAEGINDYQQILDDFWATINNDSLRANLVE